MAWLPHGEKNFEDIFIRFGATHERDGRTDRQTPGDGNSRAMHSIARQKPNNIRESEGARKVENTYHFCRAMLCISAAYAAMRCLSVCLSACLCVCHVRELCRKE